MINQVLEKAVAAHGADGEGVPLHVGLSALVLELLFRHVANDSARADTYAAERRKAFGQAAKNSEKLLAYDVKTFKFPLAHAGDGRQLLHDAWAALKGRRSELRQIAKGAVAALKEAGLPDDLWLYVEPQIDRYTTYGKTRKWSVRTMIKLLL